jgi:hypothetical protein
MDSGERSSLNEYLAHISVGRAVGFERGLEVVARAAVVPDRLLIRERDFFIDYLLVRIHFIIPDRLLDASESLTD